MCFGYFYMYVCIVCTAFKRGKAIQINRTSEKRKAENLDCKGNTSTKIIIGRLEKRRQKLKEIRTTKKDASKENIKWYAQSWQFFSYTLFFYNASMFIELMSCFWQMLTCVGNFRQLFSFNQVYSKMLTYTLDISHTY